MLVALPTSTCDVCLERYAWDAPPAQHDSKPHVISCGHVFCQRCLQNLRIPRTCPLCRGPFHLARAVRVHVEVADHSTLAALLTTSVATTTAPLPEQNEGEGEGDGAGRSDSNQAAASTALAERFARAVLASEADGSVSALDSNIEPDLSSDGDMRTESESAQALTGVLGEVRTWLENHTLSADGTETSTELDVHPTLRALHNLLTTSTTQRIELTALRSSLSSTQSELDALRTEASCLRADLTRVRGERDTFRRHHRRAERTREQEALFAAAAEERWTQRVQDVERESEVRVALAEKEREKMSGEVEELKRRLEAMEVKAAAAAAAASLQVSVVQPPPPSSPPHPRVTEADPSSSSSNPANPTATTATAAPAPSAYFTEPEPESQSHSRSTRRAGGLSRALTLGGLGGGGGMNNPLPRPPEPVPLARLPAFARPRPGSRAYEAARVLARAGRRERGRESDRDKSDRDGRGGAREREREKEREREMRKNAKGKERGVDSGKELRVKDRSRSRARTTTTTTTDTSATETQERVASSRKGDESSNPSGRRRSRSGKREQQQQQQRRSMRFEVDGALSLPSAPDEFGVDGPSSSSFSGYPYRNSKSEYDGEGGEGAAAGSAPGVEVPPGVVGGWGLERSWRASMSSLSSVGSAGAVSAISASSVASGSKRSSKPPGTDGSSIPASSSSSRTKLVVVDSGKEKEAGTGKPGSMHTRAVLGTEKGKAREGERRYEEEDDREYVFVQAESTQPKAGSMAIATTAPGAAYNSINNNGGANAKQDAFMVRTGYEHAHESMPIANPTPSTDNDLGTDPGRASVAGHSYDRDPSLLDIDKNSFRDLDRILDEKLARRREFEASQAAAAAAAAATAGVVTNPLPLGHGAQGRDSRGRGALALAVPGAQVVGIARSVGSVSAASNGVNMSGGEESGREYSVDYGYGYAERYRVEDTRAGLPLTVNGNSDPTGVSAAAGSSFSPPPIRYPHADGHAAAAASALGLILEPSSSSSDRRTPVVASSYPPVRAPSAPSAAFQAQQQQYLQQQHQALQQYPQQYAQQLYAQQQQQQQQGAATRRPPSTALHVPQPRRVSTHGIPEPAPSSTAASSAAPPSTVPDPNRTRQDERFEADQEQEPEILRAAPVFGGGGGGGVGGGRANMNTVTAASQVMYANPSMSTSLDSALLASGANAAGPRVVAGTSHKQQLEQYIEQHDPSQQQQAMLRHKSSNASSKSSISLTGTSREKGKQLLAALFADESQRQQHQQAAAVAGPLSAGATMSTAGVDANASARTQAFLMADPRQARGVPSVDGRPSRGLSTRPSTVQPVQQTQTQASQHAHTALSQGQGHVYANGQGAGAVQIQGHGKPSQIRQATYPTAATTNTQPALTAAPTAGFANHVQTQAQVQAHTTQPQTQVHLSQQQQIQPQSQSQPQQQQQTAYRYAASYPVPTNVVSATNATSITNGSNLNGNSGTYPTHSVVPQTYTQYTATTGNAPAAYVTMPASNGYYAAPAHPSSGAGRAQSQAQTQNQAQAQAQQAQQAQARPETKAHTAYGAYSQLQQQHQLQSQARRQSYNPNTQNAAAVVGAGYGTQGFVDVPRR